MTNIEFKIPETNENFEELLNEQFGDNGRVIAISDGELFISLENAIDVNKELDKLIKKNKNYAYENFQFSILEVFLNTDGNQKFILDREKHWKEVLQSKEFGYNKN